MPRAVVIGSGPNGLAAAVTLARAGWRVDVHEAAPTIGGGMRTEELTLPGFRHDVCSAIHPLGRASPVFRDLALDVEWIDPPAAAAHPLDDGTAVVLDRSLERTVESLGIDGRAYRRLVEPLVDGWEAIEPVLLGPLPPTGRALVGVTRALGPRALAAGIRTAFADARAAASGLFATDRGRAFFAGHAAHSMLPLERRPSAGFALALLVLAHTVGWPFPRGGSHRLADALADAVRAAGGEIHVSSPVDELPRADAVLADVVPQELLRLARGRFPRRYERALGRYRHGPGAFKVDWALSAPIPWRAPDCGRAATIHLGGGFDEIAASERAPWSGRDCDRPFVLLAQQSLWDDTRAPGANHAAWAYCHVPNGSAADMTSRIEAQVERFAPGFRDVIVGRSTLSPRDLESHNRNLVGGDLNGGAMDLAQLLFRPVRKLVPYRTPLRGVYICSAATPPGGGVHGMCGYSAALLAMRDVR